METMGFVIEKAAALLKEHPGWDEHQLSMGLIGDLESREYRPALEEALPEYLRPLVQTTVPPRTKTRPTPKPASVPVARSSSHSHRFHGLSRVMRKTWGTNDPNQRRKPLADFDVSNCEYASQTRRNQAKANNRTADAFDLTKSLLIRHNVKTVRDLPPAAQKLIEEAFG